MIRNSVKAVLVLAVLGAVGWQVWRKVEQRRDPPGRGRAGAVAVEVAPVGRETVRQIENFTGTLQARSSFVVAPKIAGRLEKLFVNVGDFVHDGDPVGELDDQEYAQQVEQDRAELLVAQVGVEDAQIALGLAERELDRVDQLRRKGIASEAELDEANAQYQIRQARLKVAQAQVTQRQASLNGSLVRLSYTRIAAAWEGGAERRVIGQRFVDPGAMLRANDPIVTVLDLDVMTAILQVTERDYAKLYVGQPVTVTVDALPGRTFDGAVVRIAPLVQETSRQARVEVELPNPPTPLAQPQGSAPRPAAYLLKPGMFVSAARVELAVRQDATVVPTAALVRREGRQGVFLADLTENTAHFLPVTVGIIQGELAEISEPAIAGHVVVLGQHLLEDGSPIRVVSAARPRPTVPTEVGTTAPDVGDPP